MKKPIVGIVIVVVIILIALYMNYGRGSVASAESFETEAAAILSSPATNQVKIDQLNARLKARQTRASKVGAVAKPLPLSPAAQKTAAGTK
ncbi:hypothetical protein KW800_01960 [Candidatus Parcubacteria bacterium]|nr:hypothetical protein [Candidatus Parcubacteria bacterium]